MFESPLTLGAMVAFVWGLSVFVAVSFWNLEEVLSKESKTRLVNLLSKESFGHLLGLIPGIIFKSTQSLFGEKFFTSLEFLISIILSTVFFLLVCLFWYSINSKSVEIFLESIYPLDIANFLIYFLLFNLIVDYFSLVETRYLIFLSRKSDNWQFLCAILLLDAVITLLISLIPLAIVSLEFNWDTFDLFMNKFFDGLIFVNSHPWEPPLGLFFYTTFLTSIWIWIFVLATLLTKVIAKVASLSNVIFVHLNFEEYPLRSIGIIGAFMTFSFGLFFVAVWKLVSQII